LTAGSADPVSIGVWVGNRIAEVVLGLDFRVSVGLLRSHGVQTALLAAH
jgi:hypothetical protein